MTKSIGQAGPPSDTHSVLGRRRAFIITDLVLRLLRELKMDKNKKRGRFTKKQPLFNVPMRENYYFLLKPCTTIDWAFIDILCQTCWYNDRAVG